MNSGWLGQTDSGINAYTIFLNFISNPQALNWLLHIKQKKGRSLNEVIDRITVPRETPIIPEIRYQYR